MFSFRLLSKCINVWLLLCCGFIVSCGGSSGSSSTIGPGTSVMPLLPIEGGPSGNGNEDFVVEISKKEISASSMISTNTVGNLIVSIARLISFGEELDTFTFPFDHRHNFLPNFLLSSVSADPESFENGCYTAGFIKSEVRINPNVVMNFEVDDCLDLSETKQYYNGNVTVSYDVEDSPKFLSIEYDEMHFQYKESETGFIRGEILNGTITYEYADNNYKIVASLDVLSNIDGLLTFDDIVFNLNGDGVFTSASGRVGTSDSGFFELSFSNGRVILNQGDNFIELEGNEKSLSSTVNINGDIFGGSDVRYSFLDIFDSLSDRTPHQVFPMEQVVNTDVNLSETTSQVSLDEYLTQNSKIIIDMRDHFSSLNEQILSYDLQLDTMLGKYIFGGNKDSKFNGFVEQLPESARPEYTLTELQAGLFELVFFRVAGGAVRFTATPIVKSISGDIVEADTFNIFVHGDYDLDGVLDNEDPDTDNDGVINDVDDLPFDFFDSIDTDFDGVGNSVDLDIDGDGVANTEDFFPLNDECDEAFSGVDNQCFMSNIDFRFDDSGISKSGIFSIFHSESQHLVRFNVHSNEYLPPVNLSFGNELDNVNLVLSRKEFDEVLVSYSGNEILYSLNVGSSDSDINVKYDYSSIEVSNPTFEFLGDYLVISGFSRIDGDFYAYLIDLDSASLVDTLVSSVDQPLCENQTKNFFSSCIYILDEKWVSHVSDHSLATIERALLVSPTKMAVIDNEYRLYDVNHKVIYPFSKQPVAWLDAGIVVDNLEGLSFFDIAKKDFTFYFDAPFSEYKELKFFKYNNQMLMLGLNLENKLKAIEINFIDDLDRDGVVDVIDDYPFNANAAVDSDGDGDPNFFLGGSIGPYELELDLDPTLAKCGTIMQNNSNFYDCSPSLIAIPNRNPIFDFFENFFYVDKSDNVIYYREDVWGYVEIWSRSKGDLIESKLIKPRNKMIFGLDDIDNWLYSEASRKIYLIDSTNDVYSINPWGDDSYIHFEFNFSDVVGSAKNVHVGSLMNSNGDFYFSIQWQNVHGVLFRTLLDEFDFSKKLDVSYPYVDFPGIDGNVSYPLSSEYWSVDLDKVWFATGRNSEIHTCKYEIDWSNLTHSECVLSSVHKMPDIGISVDFARKKEFSVAPNEKMFAYNSGNYRFDDLSYISSGANVFSNSYENLWSEDNFLYKFDKSGGITEVFDEGLNFVSKSQERAIGLAYFSDGFFELIELESSARGIMLEPLN